MQVKQLLFFEKDRYLSIELAPMCSVGIYSHVDSNKSDTLYGCRSIKSSIVCIPTLHTWYSPYTPELAHHQYNFWYGMLHSTHLAMYIL